MKKPKISNTPILEDEDLFDLACKHYFKTYGEKADQPSRVSSQVTKKYVILTSGNRLLAFFNHQSKQFIEPTKSMLRHYGFAD